MNPTPTFQGIVWDLGGLFIQVYPEKVGQKLTNYQNAVQGHPSPPTFDQIHQRFECGTASALEFDTALAEALGTASIGVNPADDRRKLWNSMLGPWQGEALNCVSGLRAIFSMVLLSNTNLWHQEAFETSFLQQFGKPLGSYFDRVVYSHLCGMRKPNPSLYLHAIQGLGIEPSAWMMIDDNKINLDGARQAGLQTFLHPSNTSPFETINRLGLRLK